MKLAAMLQAWTAISVVVVSGAVAGQYAVSLSVSDTDPTARQISVLDEAEFSLYLWLTCASTALDGVSAVEAEVVTGLSIQAFEPLGGALSAGTPEHLLLARSCAQPEPPFLLGRWTLVGAAGQTSGGVCLRIPGSKGPDFWASCCAGPHLCWDTGGVHGFSIGDTAPCSAANGCEEPTGVKASSWGETKALYRYPSN